MAAIIAESPQLRQRLSAVWRKEFVARLRALALRRSEPGRLVDRSVGGGDDDHPRWVTAEIDAGPGIRRQSGGCCCRVCEV